MEENKTVLITGASSGIGKELAYTYAQNMYNLVLVARRVDKLNNLKADIESKFRIKVDVFEQDLSLIESAGILFNKVNDIKVDVLINNAGFGVHSLSKNLDVDNTTDLLMLNIVTLTRLTKMFANKMLNSKNGGKIVNIASTAAFQAVPMFAAYAASKAYVLHFTEALASEYKNTNVNFTAICPGVTESEFMEKANVKGVKFFKMATSKQVSEFTYKAEKNNKIIAIPGFLNNIMVFILRFSPRKINTYIASKIFD